MNSGSVELKIDLVDLVTPKSCSAIIVQLIKYIVYQKQQIPYPYERLEYYIKRRKESQKQLDASNNVDGCGSLLRNIFAVERHYKKVEEAFKILENTFKNIEMELLNSDADRVQEVAVLFGSTIISPKDVYRIQVPTLALGHIDSKHGIQKQVLNVFRQIIESHPLQMSLDKHVGLTNMFVLLKFRNGTISNSGWFLPKDNYKISSRVSHLNVSFGTSKTRTCRCLSADLDGNFTPFMDNDSSEASSPSSAVSAVSSALASIDSTNCIEFELLSIFDDRVLVKDDEECCVSTDFDEDSDSENWFQTKQTLKGFRDFKINGTPVVNIWHRSQYFIEQE